MQNDVMSRLIAAFRKLPGVGGKTAMRYAYKIIEMDESEAQNFADAVCEAKRSIRLCKICGNYSEDEICRFCSGRDGSVICVVGDPKDILAFEKMGGYNGVYHVLHGTIDFQKGRGADDIRLKELLARLDGAEEIIIATNADVSGELTAAYIAKLLKPFGVRVTRLAYGISVGSEIEFADELTLQRALADRKEI